MSNFDSTSSFKDKDQVTTSNDNRSAFPTISGINNTRNNPRRSGYSQIRYNRTDRRNTSRYNNSTNRHGHENKGNRGNLYNSNNNKSHVDLSVEELGINTENTISIEELHRLPLLKLRETAEERQIEITNNMVREDIIYEILKHASNNNQAILVKGLIDIMSDGFGFLRYESNNYNSSIDNIYIPQNQVRHFSLLTGDIITGYISKPKANERYFSMLKILKINEEDTDQVTKRIHFDDLTPLFPREKLNLDLNIGSKKDVATRVIDLVAPIGKGQRALIVAPPRTGKTVLMKNIAYAINQNHPEIKLIVLLIDERPEEVTDMIQSVKGEVVSSTFDESADRHVNLAEIVIAKAKRLVESGHDVLILLDSITRLARAYNTIAPSSGKILTGGIDANALQRPKKFFGVARNVEGKGSLTIIATILEGTGSRMDDVIFEELKGRGNCEIVLDRRIADKRLFPAIDIVRSGTRKEEEMIDPDLLSKRWAIRRLILNMGDQIATNDSEPIEFLLIELRKTENNQELFLRMNN